jgi:serum/glucocorticoid-regulated kinase 3
MFHFFLILKEKMNSSTATNSNANITGPLTLHVIDAQTSAENGRKFTKYKVSVNYNGQEWEIWRRYKEFHTLNEKLRRVRSDLKLPGRRLLGDSFEPDFVLKRQRGLNEYVQQVSTNVQIVNLPEFIEFFGLNSSASNAPPTPTINASQSSNGKPNNNVAKANSDEIDDPSIPTDITRVNLGKTEKTSVKPDDFEFRTCIGKGSFGKVYLARHKSEDMIYAVKVVSKALIKRKREERHIMAERDVLVKNTRHPFLVSLQYSFQTPDKLYFVMDFVNGGELFFHLQQERAFSEQRARFYAAEITSAIGYLHKLDIIYRDLKPENILLDREGHIRLTDFGLCKVMLSTEGREGRTATFCGTPEYLAPEVLRREAYTKAVDWWCLGSVTYEMLCARPPFYSRDVNEMYDNILNRPLRFIGNVSERARNLIEQLLRKSPSERLGSGPEDVADIKRQPFFDQIDWEKLEARKIPPPWKPSVSGPTDLGQVDKVFTQETISPSVQEHYMGSVTNKDPLFNGFTYVHEAHLNG